MDLPRGLRHGFAVRSGHARMLFVASPAGIEDEFRALGTEATADELSRPARRPAAAEAVAAMPRPSASARLLHRPAARHAAQRVKQGRPGPPPAVPLSPSSSAARPAAGRAAQPLSSAARPIRRRPWSASAPAAGAARLDLGRVNRLDLSAQPAEAGSRAAVAVQRRLGLERGAALP